MTDYALQHVGGGVTILRLDRRPLAEGETTVTNTKTALAPLDAINALVGRNLAANYGKGPFVLDAGELDRLTYLLKAVRDEQNRLETAIAEARQLLNTVPPLMPAHANARWEKQAVAWLNRNAPEPVDEETGP